MMGVKGGGSKGRLKWGGREWTRLVVCLVEVVVKGGGFDGVKGVGVCFLWCWKWE